MKALAHYVLLMATFQSHAQFQITFLPSNPTELHFDQLWQFDVVNAYGTSKSVRVTGILEDDNGLAIRAVSAQLTLVPGLNTSSTLQQSLRPLTIEFIKPKYQTAMNSLAGFPSGQYEWCVEIESGDHPGGKACVSKNVIMLLPPHLLSPEDGAVIEEERPVFAWSPPAPVSHYSGLTYSIRVVEFQKQQSPETALASNPVHFQLNGLRSPVLSYPTSAKAFEVGKKYVWTIVAHTSGQVIPAEEVWVFEPKGPEVKALSPHYYAIPKPLWMRTSFHWKTVI